MQVPPEPRLICYDWCIASMQANSKTAANNSQLIVRKQYHCSYTLLCKYGSDYVYE